MTRKEFIQTLSQEDKIQIVKEIQLVEDGNYSANGGTLRHKCEEFSGEHCNGVELLIFGMDVVMNIANEYILSFEKVSDEVIDHNLDYLIPVAKELNTFEALVESGLWLLRQKSIVYLYEKCFDVLYIDEKEFNIKEGLSTTNDFNATRCNYSNINDCTSEKNFMNLHIDEEYFLSSDEVENCIRNKYDVFDYTKYNLNNQKHRELIKSLIK